MKTTIYFPKLLDIERAATILKDITYKTPLIKNINVSKEHNANVFLKREDLQTVRSYKIRGAYNKISSLSKEELKAGVVCASAGNHAQGFALSCKSLNINGIVFMPKPSPQQKIDQVRMFGENLVEIKLIGDTYDDAQFAAREYCNKNKKVFIPPFDDEKIIEGQATIALEILEQSEKQIDYLFLPVGGGGLASGVASVFKQLSPKTKIVGVEPEGAASMSLALKKDSITELKNIDRFIDGASVKKVGNLNFNICKFLLDDMITVNEGKVCDTILKLYNKDALVVEPAGALSLAALDKYNNKIRGKNVVCIVSGSNNDLLRMEEIKERALLYTGLKHYFIINFPQRAGALKEFVNNVLGEDDDITYFQFSKKNNKEKGQAIVGIRLKCKNDLEGFMSRVNKRGMLSEYLNNKPDLLNLIL